jgi:hypothetical protein
MTETPMTGADAEIQLITIPDANQPNIYVVRTVADGQVIKFDDEQKGDMEMVALLRCTATASATISPGSQIIQGTLGKTGTYLTRDIPGNGKASTVNVTFEQNRVSTVTVEYLENKNDGSAPSTWTPIALTNVTPHTPVLLANGRTEMNFKSAAPVPATSNGMKIRITLTGTPNARPEIFNLRVSVVD